MNRPPRRKKRDSADLGPDYQNQIIAMARGIVRWTAAHPELDAKVWFNYPENVSVVGGIDEAIAMKFVSANEAGLRMLKELWPWDREDCPTPTMVRIALDLAVEFKEQL